MDHDPGGETRSKPSCIRLFGVDRLREKNLRDAKNARTKETFAERKTIDFRQGRRFRKKIEDVSRSTIRPKDSLKRQRQAGSSKGAFATTATSRNV